MAKLKAPTSTPVSGTPVTLRIQYIHRTHIHLWKNNPRRNDKAAIELAELIRKNGLRSPVNIWAKNMTAYKGNTTLKALDLINGNTNYDVPCILHQFKTEVEAEAYGLSDNKASEYAEWDEDILAEMLASKSMQGHLGSTGFKEKEIANILWLPDHERMKNLEESVEGMSAKIMVFQVPPTDKEEIVAILTEWAKTSGFENLVIK